MYNNDNFTLQLPVEIIREILTWIIQHCSNNSYCGYSHDRSKYARYEEDKNQCICWQLDILAISMVCKSWYRVCMELKQVNKTWLPLVNYTSFQRTFPFRSKLVTLLNNSQKLNLNFHKQVEHIVIDFASFDTIKREKIKNGHIINRRVHHLEALQNTIELIKLCNHIKRLDIVFDAGFSSLASHDDDQGNRILHTSHILGQVLKHSTVQQLALVGYNPIQRCPCCAGKAWDHYLYPLLKNLHGLETLVLQSVLPSIHVFEELSRHAQLNKIVFYKSMVTIPTKKITSVNCIPRHLWKQIKSIEILEDIEDATTWKFQQYLNALVDHVGPQLEKFVLQFGTREEIEQCARDGISDARKDKLYIQDVKSPLHQLKRKCKATLKQVLLINVPPI